MRLIDANAIKYREKDEYCGNGNSRPVRYVFDEDIAKLPTVDAVEVVHGRWIFKHDPITDPKKYFVRIVCSECNLHTGQKSNYCPQCGAKMDGGNEDG